MRPGFPHRRRRRVGFVGAVRHGPHAVPGVPHGAQPSERRARRRAAGASRLSLPIEGLSAFRPSAALPCAHAIAASAATGRAGRAERTARLLAQVTILVGNPPQPIRIPFDLFVDEAQARRRLRAFRRPESHDCMRPGLWLRHSSERRQDSGDSACLAGRLRESRQVRKCSHAAAAGGPLRLVVLQGRSQTKQLYPPACSSSQMWPAVVNCNGLGCPPTPSCAPTQPSNPGRSSRL